MPWLAVAGGFLLGEPYALLQPADVLRGLHDVAQGNGADLSGGLGLPIRMLGWQAANLGGLGLTWPVALLALGGLGVMIAECGVRIVESRKQRAEDSRSADVSRFTFHVSRTPPAALILLAAGAGLAGGLVFNRIFMLRYSQPLVPLLAVAAGVGWATIPRPGWRAAAGAVAVLVAGGMTLGQLSVLAGPHPADALVTWLNTHLQPGQEVARLWPEYADLDANRYQLIRLDPWRPDVPPGAPPDYIVLDDMQLGPATPALTTLLAQHYTPVAQFAARPHIGPFAWDEGPTPHDWKYSHPAFVVYARQP